MVTMESYSTLVESSKSFIAQIEQIELEQEASIRTRQHLEKQIEGLMERVKGNKEALDIATNAIHILQQISDQAVANAYAQFEQTMNDCLERMFENTTRRVHVKEYVKNVQYPQLEIRLEVGNGKYRSLKTDSGHGIAQIISLLSILCLIMQTDGRRILVIDEVISGISNHNRMIVDEILWQFASVGFQFIINEHGYVPKNSKVFHLEMVNDVSHVKETYIEKEGVYLNLTADKADGVSMEVEQTEFDSLDTLGKEADNDDDEDNGGLIMDTSGTTQILEI